MVTKLTAANRLVNGSAAKRFAMPPFLGPIFRQQDLFAARPILNERAVFYNPDEAVRRSRQEAEKMLMDLSIQQPLSERKTAVAHLPWHLVPENRTDPAHVKMASDLTAIVLRTPRFIGYLQVLLDAVFHGRSATQNTYGWGRAAGRTAFVIKDWIPIHGDTLVFGYDGGLGARVGLVQEPLEQRVEFSVEGRIIRLTPFERLYFCAHEVGICAGVFEDIRSAGRVKGVGLRNYLFWAWKHKVATLTNLLDHLDRWGQGLNVFYYTSGLDEEQAAIKAAVECEEARTNLFLPRLRDRTSSKGPPEFQHFELTGRGIEHMQHVVENYFDAQIRRFIIGQDLSSSAKSAGFGNGVANLHEQTKALIIRGDAVALAETLTRDLIQPLISFNRTQFPDWPPDAYISFAFDVENPNVDEVINAGEAMFKCGVQFDADEFRTKLGFSKPSSPQSANNPAIAPPPTAAPPVSNAMARMALRKCRTGAEVQAVMQRLYP
jgi:phage gp29-like protein